MDALQKVIRMIHADPAHPTSSILSALVKSLDEGSQFDLGRLYQLNYSDFGLAMDLLKQWRLDSLRIEPGWLSRAASEPSREVEFPVWMHTATAHGAVS